MLGFVEELNVKKIRHSIHSLRSELGDVDELMASILKIGLLEPVIVRPSEQGFEVVAGNRRLEACGRLGMRKIPCHVVVFDDKEAYEASLVENLQRKTLDPIEEAEAFKRYVDDYGYGGVSELAKRIGMSISYVSRRIALLDLPQSVREELLRRRKAPSIAQELLSLDTSERERVADLVIEQNVSQREARSLVTRMKNGRRHRSGDPQEQLEALSCYSLEDQRERSLERALSKGIGALKLCMARLDDVYEHIDEHEWMMREILFHQRTLIHAQLDELMKLKRKTIRRVLPQL